MATSKTKSVIGEINKTVKKNKKNEINTSIEINGDELINCVSITYGELIWVSPKTNLLYRWYEFGDEKQLPYSEIEYMFSVNRDFVNKPYFIFEDERVVEKLRLVETYSKVAELSKIDSINHNDVDAINRILDKAISYNMQEVLLAKLKDMRQNGNLTNINILNAIENKLGVDLSRS